MEALACGNIVFGAIFPLGPALSRASRHSNQGLDTSYAVKSRILAKSQYECTINHEKFTSRHRVDKMRGRPIPNLPEPRFGDPKFRRGEEKHGLFRCGEK